MPGWGPSASRSPTTSPKRTLHLGRVRRPAGDYSPTYPTRFKHRRHTTYIALEVTPSDNSLVEDSSDLRNR